MLNISGIKEGVVLDHIQAGKSMEIYKYLGLGKMDCTVAIIKNARSSKMGRKDIIKIEGPLDSLDLDVLGYIDHTITVNIIRDERIVEKRPYSRPRAASTARTPGASHPWSRSFPISSIWLIKKRKSTAASTVTRSTARPC